MGRVPTSLCARRRQSETSQRARSACDRRQHASTIVRTIIMRKFFNTRLESSTCESSSFNARSKMNHMRAPPSTLSDLAFTERWRTSSLSQCCRISPAAVAVPLLCVAWLHRFVFVLLRSFVCPLSFVCVWPVVHRLWVPEYRSTVLWVYCACCVCIRVFGVWSGWKLEWKHDEAPLPAGL